MVHLPNEIWLLIASYCDVSDLWLSVRQSNRQLQRCAEQYFGDDVLPLATLSLPIVLPTYDIRNPIRGKAVFHPLNITSTQHSGEVSCIVAFGLTETDPDYYRSHFKTRWSGMQDSTSHQLDERLRWELNILGRGTLLSLKRLKAIRQGCGESEPKLEFEWMPTMTRFFRSV